MAIALADRLISKGMNQEDVSKVISEMSSYYNRLNSIGNKITSCNACSLRRACDMAPITGMGPLHPEVMVVSDYPLLDQSTGMVDTSVFMMMLLSRISLKVDDIYWTHAVKCRADKVKMTHVNECHVHLHAEITALRPAAIIALGSTAISSLAGERVGIDESIGGDFMFDAGGKNIPVIPLYHPRSLMELPSKEFKVRMNTMWSELKQIVDYL